MWAKFAYQITLCNLDKENFFSQNISTNLNFISLEDYQINFKKISDLLLSEWLKGEANNHQCLKKNTIKKNILKVSTT